MSGCFQPELFWIEILKTSHNPIQYITLWGKRWYNNWGQVRVERKNFRIPLLFYETP